MPIAFGISRGGLGEPKGIPGGAITITGTRELYSMLDHLEKRVQKKAVNAAIGGALMVVGKAARQEVGKATATGPQKRSARKALARAAKKTIGQRFKRGGYNPRTGRTGQTIAKLGFGVGTKAVRARKIAKAKQARMERKAEGGKTHGVGISPANIHWAVLGTRKRVQETTGREVGRMPAFFRGVMARALASSSGTAIAYAAMRAKRVIERESRKRG